jgi:hypothetical protein
MVNGRDETWIRTPLVSTGECKFQRGRRAPGQGREVVVVASEMVRNADVIITIRGTNGNAGSVQGTDDSQITLGHAMGA